MSIRQNAFLLCLIALLTTCTGIPILSLPRLVKLQSGILQSNSAELMVAIQLGDDHASCSRASHID